MFQFLSKWFATSNSKAIKNPRKASSSLKLLPKIEFLEDRTTPANITLPRVFLRWILLILIPPANL
jgi:ascorbate-specific PTS system EIIC-type component UlaA